MGRGPLKFNALRTHLRRCCGRGQPVHLVAERLGHKKVEITLNIYAHGSAGRGASAMSARFRVAVIVLSIIAAGCGSARTPPTSPSIASFTINQTNVSFPDTLVGTVSSSTFVITFSSTGTAPVQISSITTSDISNFPVTTTCPVNGSLAAGSTCTITAKFQPGVAQTVTGQITISTSAGNGTVSLSGIGIAGKSQFTITQNAVAFPNTRVGLLSSFTLVVTVSSTGTAPLYVLGLDGFRNGRLVFPWVETCGLFNGTTNSFPPGTSCQFSIQFIPPSAGIITDFLTITTDAGVRTVNFLGIGTPATP